VAVAKSGSRRSARREFGEIDGAGTRRPNAEKQASGNEQFHADEIPRFFAEGHLLNENQSQKLQFCAAHNDAS